MLKKIFGIAQIVAGALSPLAAPFISHHAGLLGLIVVAGNGVVHVIEALTQGKV